MIFALIIANSSSSLSFLWNSCNTALSVFRVLDLSTLVSILILGPLNFNDLQARDPSLTQTNITITQRKREKPPRLRRPKKQEREYTAQAEQTQSIYSRTTNARRQVVTQKTKLGDENALRAMKWMYNLDVRLRYRRLRIRRKCSMVLFFFGKLGVGGRENLLGGGKCSTMLIIGIGEGSHAGILFRFDIAGSARGCGNDA